MDPGSVVLLLVAAALGVAVFRLGVGLDWPWWLAGLLALAPPAMTLLLGLYGLLGSALAVGAMYQASAR
jgi:hypothetical protein